MILKRSEVEIADCFFKKFRGLMFRKKPKKMLLVLKNQGRIEAGIHSFFVFFPFDAVWLDENWKIVDLKTVRPFSFKTPRKPAKYVLELPKGMIEKRKMKIGERIIIK